MRPKSARRVAFQWLKKAGSESYFRNDPEKSEVRQLYYGKTPPTPKEIKRGPGGKQYSTLNRYLISPKPSSLKNASLQEHDLFKTLSNLAKNNEGRWKSQRQANFIISNMVDTKRFGASSHVESWLRSNRLMRIIIRTWQKRHKTPSGSRAGATAGISMPRACPICTAMNRKDICATCMRSICKNMTCRPGSIGWLLSKNIVPRFGGSAN